MLVCTLAEATIQGSQNSAVKNNCTNDKSVEKDNYSSNNFTAHKMAYVLFSNLNFNLLLIAHVALLFGLAVMYTHLLAFAKTEGMSEYVRSLMISLLGLFSLFGRIGLGALGQLPCMNIVVLYITAILATGKCFSNEMQL